MQKLYKLIPKQKSVYSFAIMPVCATMAVVALSGTLFFSTLAFGATQESKNKNEVEAGSSPEVTGFRSARFGMSETETRRAIKRDFQLGRAKVEFQANNENRTSSLVTTVKDIFPGSDPAEIAYIHGYKQKKLIQINIVWGSLVSPDFDPQKLVNTANLLRNYFVELGFDPKNTILNTRVDDTLLIVFRSTDDEGRMVLLQLISKNVPDTDTDAESEEEEQEPVSQFKVDTLLLSYIEDINEPDIFRIKKGSF